MSVLLRLRSMTWFMSLDKCRTKELILQWVTISLNQYDI